MHASPRQPADTTRRTTSSTFSEGVHIQNLVASRAPDAWVLTTVAPGAFIGLFS